VERSAKSEKNLDDKVSNCTERKQEENGIVERKIFVVVNSETWVFRVQLMA
jgi:hypothetical protein